MDHEQESNERFVRRTWAAPSEVAGSAAGCGGVGRVPGGGGDPSDLRVGAGGGDAAGFRFNPDCSCWRCAVERLCIELEHIESVAPEVPFHHWDAKRRNPHIAQPSFEEAVLDTAVRELDGEIAALQEMDMATRRAFLFDGYPKPDGDV